MLPNVVCQDFFMAKVDLKDVYLTVPVSAEFHYLLAFQNNNGQVLQFQTLPFGFCTSPYKDNQACSSTFISSGHPYYHLPEWHVAGITNRELTSSTVLWLFSSLGFIINIPKTAVAPFSEIKFLGFTLNTKIMTVHVALPATEMNGIQHVTKVLQNKTVCLKVLSQILGKLVPMKPAVFRAPLHYQVLQYLKISMMRSGQTMTTIPPEAQKDLIWWHT